MVPISNEHNSRRNSNINRNHLFIIEFLFLRWKSPRTEKSFLLYVCVLNLCGVMDFATFSSKLWKHDVGQITWWGTFYVGNWVHTIWPCTSRRRWTKNSFGNQGMISLSLLVFKHTNFQNFVKLIPQFLKCFIDCLEIYLQNSKGY